MGRINKEERYRQNIENLASRIKGLQNTTGLSWDRIRTDLETWESLS